MVWGTSEGRPQPFLGGGAAWKRREALLSVSSSLERPSTDTPPLRRGISFHRTDDLPLVRQAGPFEFGYISPTTGLHERGLENPKQFLAHTSQADWLFYGGAAGGGKSEYLIVEAVQVCLDNPGCEVALFRRTHKDLLRSLIMRFRALVPKRIARFNATDMYAQFFNGSILWFCYCATEADVYNYQSAQWLMLGLDEASHFTEYQFMYLQTRVRSVIPHRRKRVRLASNPGNRGHGWLKRFFLRPPPELLGNRAPLAMHEVWRPERPKEWEQFVPPGQQMPTRQFIPAYFEDNWALQQNDPGYLAQLYLLGGDKGRQLAEGDWDANSTMICGNEWRTTHRVSSTDVDLLASSRLKVGQVINWHVIPNDLWRPPKGATIFGSVDYGYGAPWSAHLHAVLPGGHIRTFWEWYETRVRDEDQARWMRVDIEELGLADEIQWIVLDPAMKNSRSEVGLSRSIMEVYDDHLGRPLGIHLRPGAAGRAARMSRPNRWKDALATGADGFPNWSVTTACPHLIRTVPDVPFDEKDPEVEDGDSENHAYEDVGRFFEARPFAPRTIDIEAVNLDDVSTRHHAAIAAKHDQGGHRSYGVATLHVPGLSPKGPTP